MKLLRIALIALLVPLASAWAESITVYKSPTCGCCAEWIEIMKAKGHDVTVIHPRDLNEIKQQLGVPRQLGSCHTAVIGDYLFEGHIPEEDILAFLANPPAGARGLSAPGMPALSPGMAPEGAEYANFNVIGFDDRGRFFLFNEY